MGKEIKKEIEEVVKEVVKEEAVKEAVVAQPKAVVVESKLVKVISKVTGRRYIGGSWLNLVQDKELEVTSDQKRVLKEAGAIYL